MQSSRQVIRNAAKTAIRNLEVVCGELDGIIETYNTDYYERKETQGMMSNDKRKELKVDRHENQTMLQACLEYSFLLKDMITKMFERL